MRVLECSLAKGLEGCYVGVAGSPQPTKLGRRKLVT